MIHFAGAEVFLQLVRVFVLNLVACYGGVAMGNTKVHPEALEKGQPFSNKELQQEIVKKNLELLRDRRTDRARKEQITKKLFELRIAPQLKSPLMLETKFMTTSLTESKRLNRTDKSDIEIIERYLTISAETVEFPKIKLLAGTIFLRNGLIEAGVMRLMKVVTQHPRSLESKEAIKLILGFHKIRKNYEKLVSFCDQIISQQGSFDDQELLLFVNNQLREALWEWGQELNVRKHSDVLRILNSFVERFPSDHRVDEALVVVADYHMAEGNGKGMLSAGMKLVNKFPDSRFRKITLLKMADAFAEQIQFENAGEILTTYAKNYPTDPRAAEMLLKAIRYYRLGENFDAATLRSQDFVSMFPEHESAIDVEMDLAESLEFGLDFEGAAKSYKKISEKYKESSQETAIYAQVKHALILLNHTQPKLGRSLVNLIDTQVMNAPRLYRAKEALARQKLADTKIAFLQVMRTANLESDDFVEFEKGSLELQRMVSEFQQILLNLIEVADTETKGECFLELSNLYENLVKIYRSTYKYSQIEGRDREKFRKHRDEIIALSRKQILSSLREGYRVTQSSGSASAINRKISFKLSKWSLGQEIEFKEDFLDSRYVVRGIAR